MFPRESLSSCILFINLKVLNFTEDPLCHEFNKQLYVSHTVQFLTASLLPSISYTHFSSRFIYSSLRYMQT